MDEGRQRARGGVVTVDDRPLDRGAGPFTGGVALLLRAGLAGEAA